MKILHTSDWHLGHMLYNYDRTDEHKHVLDQIIAIVKEQKPDVMLLTGDVFHTTNPSASVHRFYNDIMLDLHDAHPSMRIVVTAGNHDGGRRLEETQRLWEHFSVDVIGNIKRDEDGNISDQHIIEIKDKCFIVAVPHTYAKTEDVFNPLLQEVEKHNTNNLPVIMTAHMAVAGSDIKGHNTNIIGGMDTRSLSEFGTGYDYLALGHIHRPQWIDNSESHARYSGSIIPVSFDEDYEHSVTMIDISRHGEKIESNTTIIPLTPLREVKTIPDEAVTFEEGLEILQNLDKDDNSYIRLKVKVKDFLPANSDAKARLAVEGKECRYCTFLQVHETSDTAPSDHRSIVIRSHHEQATPLEVALNYYKQTFGTDMDQELIDLFNIAENTKDDEITETDN